MILLGGDYWLPSLSCPKAHPPSRGAIRPCLVPCLAPFCYAIPLPLPSTTAPSFLFLLPIPAGIARCLAGRMGRSVGDGLVLAIKGVRSSAARVTHLAKTTDTRTPPPKRPGIRSLSRKLVSPTTSTWCKVTRAAAESTRRRVVLARTNIYACVCFAHHLGLDTQIQIHLSLCLDPRFSRHR
jgi:hypothetical protein